MLSGLPTTTIGAIGLGVSFLLYNIGLVIYRLYFHPLSRFPGPKLNAATLWVDMYYEVFKLGQFTFKLKEWHNQYGPIVRINPDELHILDPEFYEDIYTSASRPRDKWPWWNGGFGLAGSSFSTNSHELHRQRRGMLNSFFSKQTILSDAQPIVRAKVAKLLSRLRLAASQGSVIRLDAAFMALTMDIICAYSLDDDKKYLDHEDFYIMWQECIRAGFQSTGLARHMPWFPELMKSIPPAIMLKMIPTLGVFLQRQADVADKVKAIWYEENNHSDQNESKSVRRSMIHSMRDAPQVRKKEHTPQRVVDEGFILLGAGSETTARMLSVTSWYLLANPDILSRARAEIRSVIPEGKDITDVAYSSVEGLPYLSSIVSEGLRLSFGVVSRLPRIVTPSSGEQHTYKGWTIPDGTPISMSQYYILTDPEIYPEPFTFRPERWLLPANPAESRSKLKYNVAMNRFLTPFGKGARACLGINLAYCEIYLTLSALIVNALGQDTEYGLELHETSFERDVKMKHDYFTGFPSEEAKGIRVRSGIAEILVN